MTTMTRGKRAVLAIILGFVGYRILVELMQLPSALLLGVLIGVATWLVTGRLAAQQVDESDTTEDE